MSKTTKAPTGTSGEYPQTMTVDGVTYRFTGWYNEAGNLIAESGWDYTPSETELADGTVNFYARYVRAEAKLTITKNVTGNMYNANDRFTFTVTYGTGTKTITLRKDQSETISIPIDAQVTITEGTNSYTFSVTAVTPSYLNATVDANGKTLSFTMPNEDVSITINNDKTITVDTGISLDSLPFVLILGFAAAGAAVLVRTRRGRYDR